MSEHKDPAVRKHFWEHPASEHDPYPSKPEHPAPAPVPPSPVVTDDDARG